MSSTPQPRYARNLPNVFRALGFEGLIGLVFGRYLIEVLGFVVDIIGYVQFSYGMNGSFILPKLHPKQVNDHVQSRIHVCEAFCLQHQPAEQLAWPNQP